MFRLRNACLVAACAAACVTLSACGSRRNGPSAAAASYTVGGSASAFSGTLGLQDVFGPAGGATTTDPLTLLAPGNFTFAHKVPQGNAYQVSAISQPTDQYCSVGNGSGTATANITNVAVHCAAGVLKLLYANASATTGSGVTSPLTFDAEGNAYGEVGSGGKSGAGIVYEIDSSGKFSVLYNFLGGPNNGAQPFLGLTWANGALYGITQFGGPNGGTTGAGVLFKISSAGESVVQAFGVPGAASGTSDGANPSSPLLLAADGNLYGVVMDGGAHNTGGIYDVSPRGTYTLLYSFPATGGLSTPVGPLIQDSKSGIIYGTCAQGGPSNNGGVFAFDPSHDTEQGFAYVPSTSAAIHPGYGVVMAPDGDLYGESAAGSGVLFQITPSGTWSDVYTFSNSGGGVYDVSSPLVVGNDGKLYGSSPAGGAGNAGGLWSYDPASAALTLLQTYNTSGASAVVGTYTSLSVAPNGWLYSPFNSSNTVSTWGVFAVN